MVLLGLNRCQLLKGSFKFHSSFINAKLPSGCFEPLGLLFVGQVATVYLLFGVDLKARHAGNANDEGRLATFEGEFRSKRA
jgi:hypothetical protein